MPTVQPKACSGERKRYGEEGKKGEEEAEEAGRQMLEEGRQLALAAAASRAIGATQCAPVVGP